jgi:hypothetical protein
MAGECSTHEDDKKCIGPTHFLLIYMKGRDHFRDQDIYGRIILKLILKEYGGSMLTHFIWLRIGISGVVL